MEWKSSAEQFYQLLGGEPKHDKEKAWRVYGLRFLSGCGKCLLCLENFVRGVVHIGLKIILRGKIRAGPAPLKW